MSDEPKMETLQAEIVRRFMNDDEWNEFMKEYRSNRRGRGFGANRAIALSEPLTSLEKEALLAYLDDTDVPTTVLAATLNIPATQVHSKVYRAGIKFLYQNLDALRPLRS